MWTEKRLLKALASDFTLYIKTSVEITNEYRGRMAKMLLTPNKNPFGKKGQENTAEIIKLKKLADKNTEEVRDILAVVDSMRGNDRPISKIHAISPRVIGRSTYEDPQMDDSQITVVMGRPNEGYFALDTLMNDVFDWDVNKVAVAYKRARRTTDRFVVVTMVHYLAMYYFLPKSLVRLRGTQVVNYIRSMVGEAVIFADHINEAPYIIRNIAVEKIKKTRRRGKVSICHLHLASTGTKHGDSITLNISHLDSYYRDLNRRHLWARKDGRFTPMISTEKALFKGDFVKFLAEV